MSQKPVFNGNVPDAVRQDQLRTDLRELYSSGYFVTGQRAHITGLDPTKAPPFWITEQVHQALDCIEGGEERKKRTTVIRLAECSAQGIKNVNEVVFGATDTCARDTWYGQRRREKQTGKWIKQPGWRDDPAIDYALTVAKAAAHRYYDNLEEQQLHQRRIMLNGGEQRLAEMVLPALETLFEIMTDAETSKEVRRRAAIDVLTHASEATAPKSKSAETIDLALHQAGPSMADIAGRRRQITAQIDEPEDEEEKAAPQILASDNGNDGN